MSNQGDTSETAWPGGIAAITLFVEDLEGAKRFYEDVFELPASFEDESSAVFRFGDTLINLLRTSEAADLIAPAPVATREAGVRFQLTLGVEDVDATYAPEPGSVRRKSPEWRRSRQQFRTSGTRSSGRSWRVSGGASCTLAA